MLTIIKTLMLFGLFGFVMWTLVDRTNRWNRLYDHLKMRYGKRVSKPMLIRMLLSKSTFLTFMYGSIPCQTSVKHRGLSHIKERKLLLTVSWPLTVRSNQAPRKGKYSETLLLSTDPEARIRFTSLKQTTAGSPDFRDRFHVQTTSSGIINGDTELLTGDVQHHILRLANLGRSDDLTVKLYRGKLVFSKSDVGPNFQDTADFIHQALQIFDLMRLSQSWGVKFIDSADATVIEDVMCPICTGTITDELVSCTRCQTPHCRDCWEYNGQCATFACRETRFTTSVSNQLQHEG